jgi:fibronectin type 3 domain-containing protein
LLKKVVGDREGEMGKKWCLWVVLTMVMLFGTSSVGAEVLSPVKISVFNFGTQNLDASGYGTTLTNMLVNSLKVEPTLAMLERKELEAFLSLNDLQQDENLENVVNIGARLGLNVIVVGNVEKKGSVITINCKVVQIEQRRPIFTTQLRTLGDAGLTNEVQKLSAMITQVISSQMLEKKDDKPTFKGPANVRKRSGNKRVYLSWEDPSQTAVGYEIMRSLSDGGPFAKIVTMTRTEFVDQDVDRNTTYFYKIRSINGKGGRSEYSGLIAAETALTPNPPVILRAEGHIKSIHLTWSPNPISNEDPLKLKGYKLFRAKVEQGPYLEVANILGKNLGIGMDASSTLDKLFKVTFMDKGLADGEDYYYQAVAYNEKNLESEFSCPMKVTTIPIVNGLTAQGDLVREVVLTWEQINSSFISGYYVYRSMMEDGSFTKMKKIEAAAIGQGRQIQYADREGLGDKMCYYYRVTAFEDPETETSPSVTVSAFTKGKPPTPQGLKAGSGLVKRIELTWTVSPQPEVEGYNLYWSKEKFGKYTLLKKIEGRLNAAYTDSARGFEKIGDNTTYFYAIRASNKVDVESEPTDVVQGTTKAVPAKPQGLKGESHKVREAPLSWSANPESDIDTYHVYRASGPGGGEFARIAKVQGKTNHVDKDLKDGTSYRYRILAEDKDGLIGECSDVITVETRPKPKSPGAFTGELRGGRVELSWKANVGVDIAYYTVYEKRFLGLVKIDTVQKGGFVEPGPPKGKSKSYVITASDRDGLESDPSAELTIVGR